MGSRNLKQWLSIGEEKLEHSQLGFGFAFDSSLRWLALLLAFQFKLAVEKSSTYISFQGFSHQVNRRLFSATTFQSAAVKVYRIENLTRLVDLLNKALQFVSLRSIFGPLWKLCSYSNIDRNRIWHNLYKFWGVGISKRWMMSSCFLLYPSNQTSALNPTSP